MRSKESGQKMSKTEAEIHKETFNETKTPWYKRAITPWLIIYTVALIGGGVILGWTLRSNFDSEVSSRVDFRLEQRELVKK